LPHHPPSAHDLEILEHRIRGARLFAHHGFAVILSSPPDRDQGVIAIKTLQEA
jgi:hypothetical protein